LDQQVAWNVRQDRGFRKKALLFGVRNYSGRHFQSLSVSSLNDVKDMATLLRKGDFYEDYL